MDQGRAGKPGGVFALPDRVGELAGDLGPMDRLQQIGALKIRAGSAGVFGRKIKFALVKRFHQRRWHAWECTDLSEFPNLGAEARIRFKSQ